MPINPLEMNDTRKKILLHLLVDKHREELKELEFDVILDGVINNWWKYCSCDLCRSARVNNGHMMV